MLYCTYFKICTCFPTSMMFLISGQTSITHLLAMVVYIVIEEISDVQLRHTFLKVLVFDNEVQVFVLDVQGHVRSSVFFCRQHIPRNGVFVVRYRLCQFHHKNQYILLSSPISGSLQTAFPSRIASVTWF